MDRQGHAGDLIAAIGTGDVDLAWSDGSGAVQVDFEAGHALAALLAREVVFPNSRHWIPGLPDAERTAAVLIVNCSDVFAWGCADGEVLPYGEIERLYRMWRRDPAWGPAAWAVMARKMAPQPPVAERMAASGPAWDIALLAQTDGEAARRYVDAAVTTAE